MPFLIQVVVVLVIAALAYWALSQLPIPAPFKQIINIVLALIVILWLLGARGMIGGPWGHARW
jgi:hypothetical protein